MLKLTNSFCRFFIVTCEKINSKTYVRKFAHLSRRETCLTECVDTKIIGQFHTGPQLGKQKYMKKKLRVKIPPFNSDDCKKTVQMSESLQPTTNHVSYGGEFDVLKDDNITVDLQPDQSSSAKDVENQNCNPIPPDFRLWESVGKKCDSYDGNTFKFRVLSYNVLAQYLLECHPYLYRECSPENLKWSTRSARLYDEIIKLSPDILCFQEVQVSHLHSFYYKFEQIGYFGVYKQKTGHGKDGCAIYFKQCLFEMEDHVSVEFHQPDLPLLNRDNIGLMVKLVPKSLPASPIVVATTHLLYNPKRTDVRLAQMQLLLAEIDRFAFYANGRESGHLPIVLTGDFNSMPDSAVIKLLDKGHVRASPYRDSSDWQRIGVTDNCQHLSVVLNRQQGQMTEFSNCKIYNSDYCASAPGVECATVYDYSYQMFGAMFNSGVVAHSLQLTSAYDIYKPDGKYEASTFQDYWVTVDYIYFSCCSSLRLIERLRLPTVTECDVLGCLPNDVYGSDHLALAATFELKPYKSSL